MCLAPVRNLMQGQQKGLASAGISFAAWHHIQKGEPFSTDVSTLSLGIALDALGSQHCGRYSK